MTGRLTPGALVRPLLIVFLSILSAALLIMRWQVDTPRPFTLLVGDPNVTVSGFYPIEQSGERAIRWSRPYAGVSLPALATTQIVSMTVNPAREGDVRFRLFLGVSEEPVAEFRATSPQWETYTATVKPGLGLEARIIIESDSFYPGGNDPRRLGLATYEFTTAPYVGRFGLTYPPLLLLLFALALPVIAFFAARHHSLQVGLIAAIGATPVSVLWSLWASPETRVPGLAWIVGLAAAGTVSYQAFLWSKRGTGAYPWIRRVFHSRWELPAVSLLMLGLTLVMTWPLATHLRTALPSWPGDSFGFMYKIWWFRTAFATGQWPLYDPNSYAPFGFDLGRGEPTLLNNIPGALLAAIWNEPTAYNLLTILSFVISGLGAYLLAKQLTGSRAAGLLAGVAVAFCSYRFGQYAGHFQLLGTGWIPLLFYFTERVLKRGQWSVASGQLAEGRTQNAEGSDDASRITHHASRFTPSRSRIGSGALAGLMFAFTALTAWYYAYMVGLLFALYLGVRLWALRRALNFKALVAPALAGVAVAGVLILPVALPQLLLYREGELRHSAKAADSASAAPLDYLIPNPQHPLWGEAPIAAHRHENFLDTTLYVGLVAIGIALFGRLMMRQHGETPQETRRLWKAWLILGIVAFVLSLGLTLHDLQGQYRLPLAGGSVVLPMPGQLLYDYLPLYSSMRAYARFGVIVALAVAVLMALGWQVFMRRERFRRHAPFLATAALALLLADLWSAPYVWGWSRVEPTETAKFLAAQPPGLIMQMPLESSQSGPALWQETYYGKPIAYGFDTFEPPQWAGARDRLESFPGGQSLDVLKEWGVRYIVVSANAFEESWPEAKAELDANPRLNLLATRKERRIWQVDPAPLDARPDMRRFVLPDTLVVYELLK